MMGSDQKPFRFISSASSPNPPCSDQIAVEPAFCINWIYAMFKLTGNNTHKKTDQCRKAS
eukprot:c10370_g1_i1 orf=16-195(-)